MPEPAAVLIAAVSGRALAASARRAGFVPLVADCFGDDDTLALTRAHVCLRWGAGRGIDREAGRGTTYYQRRVSGSPVSALVLGNGRTAIVLGFSAQWASPAEGRPFRYGGAVRPAMLPAELSAALTGAVERLASALPLIGLNSFDFLVEDDAFRLLEINPRPGATLDIFEPSEGSLLGLHVASCEGALPEQAPNLPGAAAACIVYADRDVGSVPVMDWPVWAADRQGVGSSVRTGDPFCTVLARAPTAAEAAELVNQRAAAVLAMLDARLK